MPPSICGGSPGCPAFGHYRGPYGDIINAIAVAQTHATGVVSAVNFDYRGFDTVGEEFILFVAATGVATVAPRTARRARAARPADEGGRAGACRRPATPCGMVALALIGPVLVVGWYLTTHAQTSPSGGFQGGVVLATRLHPHLSGGRSFWSSSGLSPVDLTDAVEAVGAGGFVAVGLAAAGRRGCLPGQRAAARRHPGAVSSSGTIALISFFVGIEVAAAFVLIVNELLEQTLVIRQERPG